MKDTGFIEKGHGMGVEWVIPYDNRVLARVPEVLESAYDILNICKVVCIHHSVYTLQLAMTLSCVPPQPVKVMHTYTHLVLQWG